MSVHSDAFETLRDCRALFIKHLGALLQDSQLVSGHAISAIQQGAGAYFDEIVSTERRGNFAEEAHGLTASRITLLAEDDHELGIRLDIEPGFNEVRTMRGIAIRLADQPGLCRKTRQAIPAAIRRALEKRPEIAYRLLDGHDLLRDT